MSYEIQKYNHDTSQWEDYSTLDPRGGEQWARGQMEQIANQFDDDNFRLIELDEKGNLRF